ncbi:alpha/beta-hydrolase [Melanomma pulvis-pyrius CBS 109.77]|uniref:Alpha/beta-hydrolase n=1 Tax=Melanomma pulvis-pyrius CBS 109.77 TaxID=1314802 RepID=A0A6A6XJG1_9PLEO|nr:alpha/beta-hydrolase [Melanomma pulvis-pyrius CBS 109.77]
MIVPIDYHKPTGKSITLGMARIKSTSNGTAPLGTLLLNFGGPGGPAASIVQEAAHGQQIFSDELMANYDIVGLDPRGVGTSNPVQCDPSIWNERVKRFPTSKQEFDALVAHNKALGASCAKLTGNLINHLDTSHVVEDFELFRRAINNGGLNFLAFSYGTQIAIQYAEKYPQNINRFVLDGVVDHSLPETTTMTAEPETYEASLSQFFVWANSSADSALRGQDVAALFDKLVENATKSPILAPSCNGACFPTVTDEDILINTQSLLAGPRISETWPQLATFLSEAAHGNATGLSFPIVTGSRGSGYSGYSFVAIGCQDWLHTSTSFADVLEKMRIGTAMFPHTRGLAEMYYIQVSCIGWPAPTSNPQHQLEKKARTAPPMLLVNSMYDAEASIVWATGVHKQLEKSVLVTRRGSGHTSYLNGVDGRTREVEEAFLIRGELPAVGTVLDD